jgi:hypothetical protein
VTVLNSHDCFLTSFYCFPNTLSLFKSAKKAKKENTDEVVPPTVTVISHHDSFPTSFYCFPNTLIVFTSAKKEKKENPDGVIPQAP